MNELPETRAKREDIADTQNKAVSFVLSQLPDGISERDALVLMDLCFHPSGTVALKHDLTPENVRQIKARNRPAFEQLYIMRNKVQAACLEGAQWRMIEIVQEACRNMNPDAIDTPGKLGQIVQAMTQTRKLIEDLTPEDSEQRKIAVADVEKALSGLAPAKK